MSDRIVTEYDCAVAYEAGVQQERAAIVKWLRSLDAESWDINRHLPTTLANWIEEGMHNAA